MSSPVQFSPKAQRKTERRALAARCVATVPESGLPFCAAVVASAAFVFAFVLFLL